MATLPLKSSHNERPSDIRLLWAKGLSTNAIQSVYMQSVYGDKYFTRPAIHVWCKKIFAHGRESVVDEEEPGAMLFRQRSERSIPSYDQTGM